MHEWACLARVTLQVQRELRSRVSVAPAADFPDCPISTLYDGKLHPGQILYECIWDPSDGPLAGAFLAKWMSYDALVNANMPVHLTVERQAARWLPMTLSMESPNFHDQLGLCPARVFVGGEVVSTMCDGASQEADQVADPPLW